MDCASRPHDPVCDTEGQEHPNLCFLLDYWKTLAYKGPCLVSEVFIIAQSHISLILPLINLAQVLIRVCCTLLCSGELRPTQRGVRLQRRDLQIRVRGPRGPRGCRLSRALRRRGASGGRHGTPVAVPRLRRALPPAGTGRLRGTHAPGGLLPNLRGGGQVPLQPQAGTPSVPATVTARVLPKLYYRNNFRLK